MPPSQRETACQQAVALFALARSYAEGPTQPLLLLVGGVMGTGKSTLALSLHRQLGWVLFSSDTLRKCLVHLASDRPLAEEFGQGIYSREWTARTYEALVQEASRVLADGRSVRLDATFLRRANRQAAARRATQFGAKTVFIECTCPRELALERLERHWTARLQGDRGNSDAASHASDARPALYDEQAACWEPSEPDKEPESEHIVITTAQPLAASVEQVCDVLHLSCGGASLVEHPVPKDPS